MLWLQSDLWYSTIAVFKIALKTKKDPCGFIRKSLELEKSPTRIVSISIIPHFRSDCKKNTPRGIFPEKGYDGKPSECLSLFAVFMLHNDGIFTAFVVHSGIVFASNET
jgi:hypothetical protein